MFVSDSSQLSSIPKSFNEKMRVKMTFNCVYYLFLPIVTSEVLVACRRLRELDTPLLSQSSGRVKREAHLLTAM